MTTRRQVLAAAGLAAAGLELLAGNLAPADDAITARGRTLAAMLRLPAAADRIAAAYLAETCETDWRRAAARLDMAAVLAPMDPRDARTWLGQRIRQDFAVGAVVAVDGWRLSRTEVGACLLAAGVA